MPRSILRGVYVILDDRREGETLMRVGEGVLEAGVRVVQYRAKRGVDAAVLARLRSLTARHAALLIVNDDPEAALDAGADGIHLGPEDCEALDLRAVRSRLQGKLLGISCATPAEADAALAAGADYIGVGAVFATASKADAGAPIGLEGLRRVVDHSRLPVVAVGGIDGGNIASVARSGAAMAAVISAVAGAPDAAQAARTLIARWDEGSA